MKRMLPLIALIGVLFAVPALAEEVPPAFETQAAPDGIAGLTGVPPVIFAAPTQACEADFYFDAAHTQWAGYCTGACFMPYGWCTGTVTSHMVPLGCVPCN